MSSFELLSSEKNQSVVLEFADKKYKICKSTNLQGYKTEKNKMTYGFVFSGQATLRNNLTTASAHISEGMYFCLNADWDLESQGQIFLTEVDQYSGLNMIGGPIESVGRLKYIDNCTDSLLVPPTKLGDPCLNLLVFPPGIQQTPHTHPSFRAGIVISGKGFCNLDSGKVPLQPGDLFVIPTNLKHCFTSDDKLGLKVLAFHPDSDYGPTDEVHPMINKTIIS